MKISVHIHSEYSSDSKQPVASIIEESRRLGYDAIVITDHNTVAGSLAAQEMKPAGISVIAGAEFSTDKGHILSFFIDETIEKSCRMCDFGSGRAYDFDDLVSKVRGQGGLLFLAHPLESKATEDPSFIADLDGYELINGRINSGHKSKRAQILSEYLKKRFPGKVLIGGSDAHTKHEIKSVCMTSDSTDLKEALLNTDCIFFEKSSVAKIRFSNMKNHPKRRLKYYVKQSAAMLLGLFFDLGSKLKGNSYEVIRVREKTQ
jgi:predicted metal-dependent phosphoesterase TrpH